MLIKSKDWPSQHLALALAGAVLLATTGGVFAQVLPPSPLAGNAPQRGDYPSGD